MLSAKKCGTLLIMSVTLAWPFIVWFGVVTQHLYWIIPLLMVVMVIRLRSFLPKRGPMRQLIKTGSIVAILICSLSLLLHQHQWLLWYPVAINLLMLSVFGLSLYRGSPIIEQLARLKHSVLSAQAIAYTRSVTQIWCLFFIINGTISATTVLINNMPLWGLWNGAISYIVMGILLAGEWLIRQWKVN